MALKEDRTNPPQSEQPVPRFPDGVYGAEIPVHKQLVLEMPAQPDDATCGPTCLHAVYRFHCDDIPLDQVIREVTNLETGGTLAVLLAIHALRRGYRATTYTYNLRVFDPTWFHDKNFDIAARLRRQIELKHDPRVRYTSERYLEYLSLGGKLRFEDLTPALIRRHLKRDLPILTGLSSTYLYGCAREFGEKELSPDDAKGQPVGHFVVLSGYDVVRRQVLVADPLLVDPAFRTHQYWVGMQRLLGAILLGVLTYDGNLLILEPPAHLKEGA
jgi:hypothetical protein